MKIKLEKIQNNGDTYWLRVHFSSDDESRKTKLLICASHEFLFNLFNTTEPEEIEISQWFEGIIKKWKLLGGVIFNKKIHLDPYANTQKGREAILKFLEEKVVS